MEPPIGTISTVRSASVIRRRRIRARCERHGRDRADEARPAPPADRRARPHRLAADIWLQLAGLGVRRVSAATSACWSHTASPAASRGSRTRSRKSLYAAFPDGRSNTSSFISARVLVIGGCGLAEFRRRNLFEDCAKLERGLLTECAFEAALCCGPARTGFGHGSLPGLCQRHHPTASILFGHFERHETALLERAQKVPQRRAIHDQKPGEILDRTRTDEAQPRQDGELVHAQPDGREGVIIKLCHAARRLANSKAIASTSGSLDRGKFPISSTPCADSQGRAPFPLDHSWEGFHLLCPDESNCPYLVTSDVPLY